MTVDMALARKVLQAEAAAIQALVDRLDGSFEQAVQLLLTCRGRVIVTGIGKSGIICQKIAATFSSTGTPAFFLHPAEAVHGDLGVIQGDDVVVAHLTQRRDRESIDLVETIKRLGAHLIAITGDCDSTLGAGRGRRHSESASRTKPARLNLVPTASTIAALALGDALAMTLLVAKGFKQEDFANLHPGGKLGKRLMRVEQLMHGGDQTPVVAHRPRRCLTSSTRCPAKGLGMTCVVDEHGRLRRHHHGRRPPAPHDRVARTSWSRTAARHHDQRPVTVVTRHAGRRGPAHPRAAEDHLDRRRRCRECRRRAWCTCTTCGAPEWSDGRAAMSAYAPLLAVLVALLVGLAVGKAWERYKLRDGRWIDRRRLRETPHYMLGLNFLVDNQVDQAIDELTQAASTDTDALEIQMILGNLYRQKGQVGRAINVHQALLQRTDSRTLEHAYVLLCLGLDFRHGGFVDRALEAFQEVVRLDPQNRYAFVNLQKLYEDQHQWAEAARVREQIAAHRRAAPRRGPADPRRFCATRSGSVQAHARRRRRRGARRSRTPSTSTAASPPRI